MADTLTTQTTLSTVPSGSIIATDDAGAGGHVQLVKLAISTDGSATALTADNTDGLLVNLGTNNDVTLATLPDTAAGDLAAINAAVSGTLTVGSHAVTNAGTFAVQVDGAALTALQLIDDAVYTDDVPFTAGSSKVMAAGFRFDDVAVDGVTEGDVGYARMSSRRELYATIRDAAGNERGVNVNASNELTVVESNSTAILADTANMDTNLATVAGAVSGTEMQVDIVSGNVTNAGTFAVQEDGAALTALQLIDDIVATDDTSTHATGTTKGAVIMAAATPTDSAVDANDLGALAMSTDRRLLVDSQIVGQDADVTIADGGNAITVDWNGTAPPIGGGVEATALRVTIASDSTGVVSIDDNSGSITVDNGGTFVIQEDGAALTALQLIDDVVYADDADWTADTSKHALIGGVTQSVPSANTDGDTTPLVTNLLRELRVSALESDLAAASTSHTRKYYTAATPTDGIIWSPAAGKRWYVTHLAINVSAASTVTVEEDKTGGDDVVYKAEFAANSGVVLTYPGVPLYAEEDAADLIITATAGTVYVTAVGYEI